MDATLLFVMVSGAFVGVIVAVIAGIKFASGQRAKQAEKEIQDYLADLKQEHKRSELQQGTPKPSLQLSISQQDEHNGFPALIRAIRHHLEFERWGFRIIHSGKLLHYSAIILQSEFCKVKILTVRDRPHEEPEVYFAYGRLHAPNEDKLATWNGEKCHCWHDVREVLNFLDGLTPQEMIKYPQAPAFLDDFYAKNKFNGWSRAEMEVRRQAAVWEQYGQRLFDLFDLRRPDVWQNYSDFRKEIYNLTVTYTDRSVTPSYKIC
jgi:hypothetical protein